jgi:hypothetical protein
MALRAGFFSQSDCFRAIPIEFHFNLVPFLPYDFGPNSLKLISLKMIAQGLRIFGQTAPDCHKSFYINQFQYLYYSRLSVST